MKTEVSRTRIHGMTLIEVLLVIVVLAILIAVFLPSLASTHARSPRISCVNNLKQIGTAYRVWGNDNGDKYPMQQADALGGMQGLLADSVNAGRYAYMPYFIMQNELGQSPKILWCPADERPYNTNFYYGTRNAPTEKGYKWPPLATYGSFDNTNVSYFYGVGAADTYPQSILGGDRNLGNGGVFDAHGVLTSSEQDPYYGISGTTAVPDLPCGADAIISTNGQWITSFVTGGGGSVNRTHAVGWSAKIHSAGNIKGTGNILLGDGSAQQCTSAGFRVDWLRHATNEGNFAAFDEIHAGTNGFIRLLFP